jgi:hypothetical protein
MNKNRIEGGRQGQDPLEQRTGKTKKGYTPKHVTLSFYYEFLGWLMGLEPTTTGITILDSTN